MKVVYFPFLTEGKTFKTNPSNVSWSEFGKGWEELMQRRGGGVGHGLFCSEKGGVTQICQ